MKMLDTKQLLNTKYIKVYEHDYEGGRVFYNATRREKEKLVALMDKKERDEMLPDAVTCFVVINVKGDEPKLLLHYEYRFAIGEYLLSPPAGLIDECDKSKKDALILTAKREIKEETGLDVKGTDQVFEINHCVFSSPGFTDECNALVGAVVNTDSLSLSEEGAVGGEAFDGFLLVNEEKALNLLKTGRDDKGHFYPIFTYGALNWFVSKAWRQEND